MPSIFTAVFFIFLQFSYQNIGCFAEYHSEQESNLRHTIKEATSKTRQFLNQKIDIVGYVVNAIRMIFAGFQCCCAGGQVVIGVVIEAAYIGGHLLGYGMKIVGYVVDALRMTFAFLKRNSACEQTVIGSKKETVSETSIIEIIMYGIKTVGVAVLAILAAPFALAGLGFGAGGIVAGGLAAWFQSVWFGGTIAGITGFVFSALQSIGAGGLGVLGMAVITFFSGIATSLYECLF